MSENLNDEIKESISKHMPGLVGSELKKRLEKAEADEQKLAKVQEEFADHKERHRKLDDRDAEVRDKTSKLDERERELKAKEMELTDREIKVTAREGLIDMREQHADRLVSNMRGVVGDVFSNNRFKYERTDTQTREKAIPVEGYPTVVDGQGYATPGISGSVEHHTETDITSTSVEGEGDIGAVQ